MGDNCVFGETVERKNILGVLTGVVRDGKMIKNMDLKYRAYVRLWCAPYHLRFFVLRVRRFAGRVKGFLKRIL